MITKVRHIGLVVVDLERALDFWCRLLGFKVARRMEESGPFIDALLGLPGVKVTTVKLEAPDGNLLELLRFHSHPDRPSWTGSLSSTGLTHLAFTVEHLDELCANLAGAGVTLISAPQSSPDGRVRVVFARGPEGVLLELVEMVTR